MTGVNSQDENLRLRIESINRMMLEVANGNFGYKIERSDRNDELEALVVVVNMMVEEMKESFMHRNNLNDSHKNLASMTFVLDNNLNIETFNSGVTRILLFDSPELEGKPLAAFLTDESKAALEILKPQLALHDDPHITIELLFKTKQTFVVPAFCTVSMLFNTVKNNRKILITAIETIRHNKVAEEELRYAIENNKIKTKSTDADDQHKMLIPIRQSDLKKIREAHDHILQDMEDSLSLKELAHAFGINEFKLKNGFKQLYGTTVFRFLMDERLKKASLLLQNTDIPLKRIAEMTGFKSFPHFSRAFKKRFGYCASDLKRASASR